MALTETHRSPSLLPSDGDSSSPSHPHHRSHEHTQDPRVHPHSLVAKKRPLATLSALRRPPIDPIVLAASLTTGPHVTRHHFHHSSYGSAGGAAGSAGVGLLGDSQLPVGVRTRYAHGLSSQMARSERLRLLREQSEKQQQQPGSASQMQRSRRVSTSSSSSSLLRYSPAAAGPGSYANCDLDDDTGAATPAATGASLATGGLREDPAILNEILQDVIGIGSTDAMVGMESGSEHALYSSRQMPRSERVKLQQKQQRLQEEKRWQAREKEETEKLQEKQAAAAPDTASPKVQAISPTIPACLPGDVTPPSAAAYPLELIGNSSVRAKPPLSVRCYARTRVPTPHGEVFCHLYRNNHDSKEHLALVVDWEQNDEDAMRLAQQQVREGALVTPLGKLRSRTLEERWGTDETEIERIVRGAYVGRLGPTFQRATVAPRVAGTTLSHLSSQQAPAQDDAAPLVRIHSECYTGETIGSQRCDCGEQLDEAIRLICSSGRSYASGKPRGVVVYLRQEGRGIGLLDKLMAYNLQDMGHDTVSANVLLGHLPDARKYDIASAILRDLGVDECRLLTNNPEKMEALEAEGVRVTERVAMVPRMWRRSTRKMRKLTAAAAFGAAAVGSSSSSAAGMRRQRHRVKQASQQKLANGGGVAGRVLTPKRSPRTKESSHLQHSIISQFDNDDAHPQDVDADDLASHHVSPHSLSGDEGAAAELGDDGGTSASDSGSSVDSYVEHALRRSGATMLGGSVTRGPELEKYLRTKVERMGHMLELPPEEVKERTYPRPLHLHEKDHNRHRHCADAGGPSQPSSPAPSTPASFTHPSHVHAQHSQQALKAPPHLRNDLWRSTTATPPATLTRTASTASNLSQLESVLGESELKELIGAGRVLGNSNATVLVSKGQNVSAAAEPAARPALSTALADLKREGEKLLAHARGASTEAPLDVARLQQDLQVLENTGEDPRALAPAAEGLMDQASSVLVASSADATLSQATVAQLSQVVLLASKVLRLAL